MKVEKEKEKPSEAWINARAPAQLLKSCVTA